MYNYILRIIMVLAAMSQELFSFVPLQNTFGLVGDIGSITLISLQRKTSGITFSTAILVYPWAALILHGHNVVVYSYILFIYANTQHFVARNGNLTMLKYVQVLTYFLGIAIILIISGSLSFALGIARLTNTFEDILNTFWNDTKHNSIIVQELLNRMYSAHDACIDQTMPWSKANTSKGVYFLILNTHKNYTKVFLSYSKCFQAKCKQNSWPIYVVDLVNNGLNVFLYLLYFGFLSATVSQIVYTKINFSETHLSPEEKTMTERITEVIIDACQRSLTRRIVGKVITKSAAASPERDKESSDTSGECEEAEDEETSSWTMWTNTDDHKIMIRIRSFESGMHQSRGIHVKSDNQDTSFKKLSNVETKRSVQQSQAIELNDLSTLYKSDTHQQSSSSSSVKNGVEPAASSSSSLTHPTMYRSTSNTEDNTTRGQTQSWFTSIFRYLGFPEDSNETHDHLAAKNDLK